MTVKALRAQLEVLNGDKTIRVMVADGKDGFELQEINQIGDLTEDGSYYITTLCN